MDFILEMKNGLSIITLVPPQDVLPGAGRCVPPERYGDAQLEIETNNEYDRLLLLSPEKEAPK